MSAIAEKGGGDFQGIKLLLCEDPLPPAAAGSAFGLRASARAMRMGSNVVLAIATGVTNWSSACPSFAWGVGRTQWLREIN
jgi:hypothetical protein